jgi:hypothetical protein
MLRAKPACETKLKHSCSVGDNKFDFELKVNTNANHEAKVSTKGELGSLKTELENTFGFNSDDHSMKNDFKIAFTPKDFDIKHQLGVVCEKGKVVFKGDLVWQCCKTSALASYVDWNFENKKFGTLGLSYAYANDVLAKSLAVSTDFSKDGCPMNNAVFDWRVIFNASKATKVGFTYNFTSAASNLKVGFQTQVDADNTLQGKLSQCGKVGLNLKTKLSPDWTLISSLATDSKALGGAQESSFGFAFEGKI